MHKIIRMSTVILSNSHAKQKTSSGFGGKVTSASGGKATSNFGRKVTSIFTIHVVARGGHIRVPGEPALGVVFRETALYGR